MHKCNKPRCITDKYVKERKSVKIATTKEVVEINANVNCTDDNVIYVISCKQCSFQENTEAMSSTRILMKQQENTLI